MTIEPFGSSGFGPPQTSRLPSGIRTWDSAPKINCPPGFSGSQSLFAGSAGIPLSPTVPGSDAVASSGNGNDAPW
ncbi:MAG: hypothetical protein M5U19_04340 [Microthrixaceae bacterium]|nr:hypothetical protein [Microthrixaceae bacterium]